MPFRAKAILLHNLFHCRRNNSSSIFPCIFLMNCYLPILYQPMPCSLLSDWRPIALYLYCETSIFPFFPNAKGLCFLPAMFHTPVHQIEYSSYTMSSLF